MKLQRALQFAFFWAGVFIVGALLLRPTLGLYLLWDVLIPVAPLLLVVAPGLWRNVCPLGTFSVLPHRLRLSKKRSIDRKWQSRLLAIAVLPLLVIVPARLILLDIYGQITGIVLITVALLAFGLGTIFDWKSAWCSGICPVYPVEMLYGSRPVVSLPNLQCEVCTGCVSPCRDSRQAIMPTDVATEPAGRTATTLLVGGFPGFVLGWYLVDVSTASSTLASIGLVYAYPFAGLTLSLVVYSLAARLAPTARVNLIFATVAVCVYYWFKLPVVVGLDGDSTHWLVHLGGSVPAWSIWAVRGGIIVLLSWLLLGRAPKHAWNGRPKAAPQLS
ncbi:hypothetical protein OAU50_05295 [Planctomycetota bacterium]|nr:hypothetical protein [Planctomycetota bacterium]